ncbi:hypothetical protein EDC04DRAFT_2600558 [Pisolithus marmoratus]|nr:hypothetical protein EDC04DRAFT_2600558 [Pisolithus marmoratus]
MSICCPKSHTLVDPCRPIDSPPNSLKHQLMTLRGLNWPRLMRRPKRAWQAVANTTKQSTEVSESGSNEEGLGEEGGEDDDREKVWYVPFGMEPTTQLHPCTNCLATGDPCLEVVESRMKECAKCY